MPFAARAGAAAAATAFVALGAPPVTAAPGTIELPKPLNTIPVVKEAFADRPERLRESQVPGRVDDTERVIVGVGPTGAPAAVTVEQRLVLHGTGQYVVWQRSSAQDVEALDDTPAPVLRREAVVWQGFVDGSEALSARLTLDPAVEARLLPLVVEIEYGGIGDIGPGGTVPAAAGIVVRLRNVTAKPIDLPTGEVAAATLAGPLDTLRAAGESRAPGVRPVAGRGLPATLAAGEVGPASSVSVAAPLRVTGTIRVPGGAPASLPGPGIETSDDGLEIDGVLHGEAEFGIASAGRTTLEIDLQAFPTVDPRELAPPGAPTWAQWAARRPSRPAVREATAKLVRAAAEAAHGTPYAPYLGLHGPGNVTTTFHFSMAPASAIEVARVPLRPKPVAIAVASLAALAVVSGGVAVWRRL